ncbi:MAG: hypothetical protein H7233_07280 [Pseudorhodobacter sp.]|nr:hypothetical protein [Frankiaceae bacterium]
MTLSPLGGSLSAVAVRRPAAAFALRLEAHPGSVPLVVVLRAAGGQLASGVVPRERFRAELRTRLLAVATVQAAATAPASPRTTAAAASWRSAGRAGGVAAGAMASVVAITGVAVAGSQSLPGDPFYGVKRQVEAFSLRTADGDVERGTRHLDHAATRLREVGGLVLGRDALTTGALAGSGDLASGAALGAPVAERVRQTLADMDTATLRGQELLESAFRSSSDAGPLQFLSRFATRQSDGLERLLPSLPLASRERALTSLAMVDGVAEDVDGLQASPPCGPTCDPAAAPSAPPVLPPVANPLEPSGPAATAAPPCGCEPAPGRAPSPGAASEPATSPGSSAEPGPGSAPRPADPAQEPTPSPSPSPTGEPGDPGQPLPVPAPSTPVPVPPVPSPPMPDVPLPGLPLPGLPLPGIPLPGIPLPSLTPLPSLAPLVPQPLALLSDLAPAPRPSGSADAVRSPIVPRVLLGEPSQPAALPLWLIAAPS